MSYINKNLTIGLSLLIGAYLGIITGTVVGSRLWPLQSTTQAVQYSTDGLDFSDGAKIMPDLQVQLATWHQPEDEFSQLYVNQTQLQKATSTGVQSTIGVE